MTLSGQEVQRNLRVFARRWAGYQGKERAEAQTFVNELFACFGSDRREAGVVYESDQVRPGGAHGFVDALWPGHCLIEMKRPSEAARLEAHRAQALDYWRHSAEPSSDRPAVDYVVLCAFKAFEVWQPGRFPMHPRAAFSLDELPDRYDALLFLGRQRPLFTAARRELTTEAAERTVVLYRSLRDRDASDSDELQSFVLQTVWSLFAASLGLLPSRPVQRIVRGLLGDEGGVRSSAADLGYLFTLLNRTDLRARGGVYADTPYVNGGLFQEPAHVHLERDELELLAEVGEYDWGQVEPTIFGSLIEGFLPRDRAIEAVGTRRQFGVHYTHESDILKIVGPTIVEPWSARIQAAGSVDDAVRVLTGLCRLRVLDPACGSGNFLYVAYRELRDLEQLCRGRIAHLARGAGVAPPEPASLPQYPLTNLHGIELDVFATRVTRLVLWMGHKLAADRYGTPEPPLPLPDLDQAIIQADALRVVWPEADVIIGNPPFNGSQRLREDLGDEYLRWLETTFGIGIRDYCTYWFRRTADHLAPGGRAGLVGTNSVAQGRGREASLDYVIERGGMITDAVPTQRWPGEAKVHVSIVNWTRAPAVLPEAFRLNGEPVPGGIAADLVPIALSTIQAQRLLANQGVAFQGPIPVGDGFILDEAEAASLVQLGDADYRQVVRPYLIGDDIAEDPRQEPRRWIIDFGLRSLEEAARYPEALAIVRNRVLPVRQSNNREYYRRYWWRLGEPRAEMRSALRGLQRYLAVGATGKRTLLAWCAPSWCPSNAVYAIALEDDYAFGVLSSSAHGLWAARRGSTLKGDPRYTNTTVFDTCPWPDPTGERRGRIAEAAQRVVTERARACAGQRGLTKVYNLVDEGGFADLAAAHDELDVAVAAAYGWPAGVASDPYEVIPRLMRLTAEIAEDRRPYSPFPERRTDAGAEEMTLYLVE
ncbi:MAG: N-6 DNA methylase [Nitriliruptorales bacterium]|nr:N-6 DNA methylase [Nitriliruptorales bacterium]